MSKETENVIHAHHFVPGDLVDHAYRLEKQRDDLLEAAECALYALEHPTSDIKFAIRALRIAIAGSENK